MVSKRYYVYLVASSSRTLYTGFTNSIGRRTWEHKQGLVPGFTKKYRSHRLVYFEVYNEARRAIDREKEIKAWRREKKVELIESVNPTWHDLAEGWYERVGRMNQKKQVPHLSSRGAGGQIRNDNVGKGAREVKR